MINVGIIGCGFVGGALKDWFIITPNASYSSVTQPRATMMT